jgi:hypothetical protein
MFATVMKFNGSDWLNVGPAGFTGTQAFYPSMGFDSLGTLYIAFQDSSYLDKASVMKFGSDASGIAGSSKENMLVYPDPATEKLTIDLQYLINSPERLEIFDVTGRMIYTIQNPEGKILLDVQNYPSGVYFIYVRTATGVIRTRFVRQ